MTQSGHGGGPAWVRRTAQFSAQKRDSLLIPDLVLGAGEAMRRREFTRLFSSAVVAWPLAARAQRSAVPVIGFLRSTTAAGSEHLAAAFEQGLKDAGFIEGQNVAIDYRWGNDQSDRLAGLAADLIRRQPAVIIGNILTSRAVIAATTTIPIVFVGGTDPVREGLVANLNHPGGNVTGVVFTAADLVAKRLGLLHDLVPKLAAIAVLLHPGAPGAEFQMKEVEQAGQTIGRQVLIVKVTDERGIPCRFCNDSPTKRGRIAHGRRSILLKPTSTARRAGDSLRAAFMRSRSQLRRGRRPYELRIEPGRCLSSRRQLRWPDSQRGEARQYAGDRKSVV